MIYKTFTKDDKGNVKVFASSEDKNEAIAAVKEAEKYPMYVDAWYVRTE